MFQINIFNLSLIIFRSTKIQGHLNDVFVYKDFFIHQKYKNSGYTIDKFLVTFPAPNYVNLLQKLSTSQTNYTKTKTKIKQIQFIINVCIGTGIIFIHKIECRYFSINGKYINYIIKLYDSWIKNTKKKLINLMIL